MRIFRIWMLGAALVGGSVLAVPAQAGSCPQGTYESCPDHGGGVEGPCHCQPIGKRPKYSGVQTIVNNTNSVNQEQPAAPETLGNGTKPPADTPGK